MSDPDLCYDWRMENDNQSKPREMVRIGWEETEIGDGHPKHRTRQEPGETRAAYEARRDAEVAAARARAQAGE